MLVQGEHSNLLTTTTTTTATIMTNRERKVTPRSGAYLWKTNHLKPSAERERKSGEDQRK